MSASSAVAATRVCSRMLTRQAKWIASWAESTYSGMSSGTCLAHWRRMSAASLRSAARAKGLPLSRWSAIARIRSRWAFTTSGRLSAATGNASFFLAISGSDVDVFDETRRRRDRVAVFAHAGEVHLDDAAHVALD